MEKTIWLHVKTGGFYAIHEIGLREYDLEPQFAYRRLGEGNKPEGITFYRTVREFLDGRFTQFQVNGVGGAVENGKRPAKVGKLPASSFHYSDDQPRLDHVALDGNVESIEIPDRQPVPGVYGDDQPVQESVDTQIPMNVDAIDADGNRIVVGDFLELAGEMTYENRKFLVREGPWRVNRISEPPHRQVFFSGDKKQTGWYAGIFRKVEPDELD